MGAIVNVFYGPPSHRRLEGKAELKTAKHLRGARYRVRLVFLGDPSDCLQEREIDLDESSIVDPPKPKGGGRKR